MVYELIQQEKAAPLFKDWPETMIWSCLQGVMGKLYGDSSDNPVSCMALLGDFCFLAGRPDREFLLYLAGKPEQEFLSHPAERPEQEFLSHLAGKPDRELLSHLLGRTDKEPLPLSPAETSVGKSLLESPKIDYRQFRILVPQDQAWADLIRECYGAQARQVVRYAIKKEPEVFDRKALQAVVDGLPSGYTLKMMDEPLFWKCREIPWCRDWVAQYEDYAMYERYGLGAVTLKDGEPVSGASSYSGYIGGIEVEIDTREDFRRKGLAYVCGAKLILECLDRGWYPSWDAQNLWSVALAEKLGYHLEGEYAAFECWYE